MKLDITDGEWNVAAVHYDGSYVRLSVTTGGVVRTAIIPRVTWDAALELMRVYAPMHEDARAVQLKLPI